jgi:hypothetical protein
MFIAGVAAIVLLKRHWDDICAAIFWGIDKITEFLGFGASSASQAGTLETPSQLGGAQRALFEEVGYKFDNEGKILEEPQGSQEEIDARFTEAKRRRESMPAAEPLAQQAQNQAAATAQAATAELRKNPQSLEVKNNVTVKNEPVPVVIELDREKLGESMIQYMAHEEVLYGGAG